MGAFPGRNAKRSPTALQSSEHDGIGSTISPPKDDPKEDHERRPQSLFEPESGEGVKPLGKVFICRR